MCRYKFGEGRCSHPSNMALECVGEDNCQFDAEVGASGFEKPDDDKDGKRSDRGGCPDTEIGIYCKKYGYFHCSGKENCQTREEYIEHLKENKEAVQNIKDVQDVEGNFERKD